MAFFYSQHDSIQRLIRSEARELEDPDLEARPYLISGFSKIGFDAEDSERKLKRIEEKLPSISPVSIETICNDGGDWARLLGGWQ
jgi:hypothetical protein